MCLQNRLTGNDTEEWHNNDRRRHNPRMLRALFPGGAEETSKGSGEATEKETETKMTIQYNLNDEERNARLQILTASEDLLTLKAELGLLRELLERAARDPKRGRMVLDAVAQITKTVSAIENAQIRAKQVLLATDVTKIIGGFVEITSQLIDRLPITQEERHVFVDALVCQLREKQKEVLLLEAPKHEQL